MNNYFDRSLALHRKLNGKWEMNSKVRLSSQDDLSLAYTPGVASVSEAIDRDLCEAYSLTMKGNSVAIVSDGSAVLGLGKIGPEAALPVMEGKAILFKAFAGIDGVPVVVRAESAEEIIHAVQAISPTFGGVNLEDIAAPVCFEVEAALQDLGIPVFHDDQHGTAIVLLAGLMNAARVVNKPLETMKVVINGAGAAGIAIAKLLRCVGQNPNACAPVRDVLVCDSKGIISRDRSDLNPYKQGLLDFINRENRSGSLQNALVGADVFIGVSKGNLLDAEDIESMGDDPIIFAMANPIPEIMPDLAKSAGAAVVGTGRSDLPNQVNNVLAFPGIFRGALNAMATQINDSMKLAAAHALASTVPPLELGPERILRDPLDRDVTKTVAKAVQAAAVREGVLPRVT